MSPTYNIRQATPEDLAAVAICGRDFDAEGGVYNTVPLIDDELYADLAGYIEHPDFIVTLAETQQGLPAGFCIFGINKVTGRRAYEALMTWFYIRPAYRNLSLANTLLDYSLTLCKDKGAIFFFASATAGFNDDGTNERAFSALLKRKGFKFLGSVFMLREDGNV